MSMSEDLLAGGSGSFWEVESYKRTVKRHDDGWKLCGEVMTLIQERADIEKHYAKSLRNWSKKWNDLIDKGPEYGTSAANWKGCLTEAESIADLHITVKDQLIGDAQASVKQWRQDNFKKSIVGQSKETKDLDDSFKKAQKPWAKRLSKVVKAKKDYHTACKNERSATNQEMNARGDSSNSPDQMKKLTDKVDKCKREVNNTRDKYESALNDLNSYNAKYMEEMTEVYERSQDYEEKRLKFFKELFLKVHKALNLSTHPQFSEVYHQLEETINLSDHQKDLKYWSTYHGVDMPMNWPAFEEYSPELQSIHKKRGGGSSHGDGITLTRLQHKPDSLPPTNGTSAPPQTSSEHSGYDNSAISHTPVDDRNPFGADDDDGGWGENTDYDGDFGDLGEPVEGGTVRVKALYSYTASEDDEISFNIGDEFIKLRNKNKQGWCLGEINGKVGLYPDNYIEIL